MGAARKLSNDLYVGPAPTGLAPRVIGAIEPQVKRALREGFDTHSINDLIAAIERRDMQLWNAIADGEVIGVTITEILRFPQKKVCNLFLIAAKRGSFSTWGAALLEQIEVFARNQGASLVTARGRIGWTSMADAFGFAKPFVYSAKDIGNGR